MRSGLKNIAGGVMDMVAGLNGMQNMGRAAKADPVNCPNEDAGGSGDARMHGDETKSTGTMM